MYRLGANKFVDCYQCILGTTTSVQKFAFNKMLKNSPFLFNVLFAQLISTLLNARVQNMGAKIYKHTKMKAEPDLQLPHKC